MELKYWLYLENKSINEIFIPMNIVWNIIHAFRINTYTCTTIGNFVISFFRNSGGKYNFPRTLFPLVDIVIFSQISTLGHANAFNICTESLFESKTWINSNCTFVSSDDLFTSFKESWSFWLAGIALLSSNYAFFF